MRYDWGPWSSVSEGRAKPGSRVSAIRDGERFALFVADPSGSIYSASGTPDGGWGPWASVSQGQSTPGAPVDANWDGKRFVLFVADPNGGVYSAAGTSEAGWGPWSSVSEGRTIPGGSVTSVWDGKRLVVFLADPNGGVYAAAGTPNTGWGPWSSVSQGRTIPGASVTAVWEGRRFVLFLADPNGGVYTAAGTPESGWGPWSSVSEGRSAPGGTITAVSDGRRINLFLADPSGGVYTAAGSPDSGWGPWSSVSDGRTTAGAPVTAAWDGERFAVIVADPKGGVFACFGTIEAGWTPWSSVSEGQTTPGGPVTAFWNTSGTQLALFLTDPNGGIYAVGARPPVAPRNLHPTAVTGDTIGLAWVDDAGDQDGFRISYVGKRSGSGDDRGNPINLPPGARATTLTGLQSGYTYTINLVAFNDATGVSPSATLTVTTALVPQVVMLTLQRQEIVEGPIPYAGHFPAFGIVRAGHLQQIAIPESFALAGLQFVKAGHDSTQCSEVDAVVAIPAGGHTTPAQLTAIFGGAPYPIAFSTDGFGLVACILQPPGAPLLDIVDVQLTVIFDG
jgi:hypothetical protein